MTGPYENPIDLATYLIVIVPMLLAYAAHRRGVRRFLLWGLAAGLVALLGQTEAKSAWLGLAVGVLLVAVWHRQTRRFGLLIIAATLLVGGICLSREARWGKVVSLSDIGKVDRWVMWQAAARMIHDRPVLGHGVNTFMANYLRYWVGGERQPRYAHNCYLQMAAETGVIGLAAFLWLLGLVVAVLGRGLQAAGDGAKAALLPDRRMLLAGCLIGLIAFLVQAAFDTNFYAMRQVALFWLVAGLAIGVGWQAPGHS